jgi:cytochrome o ubiquinol oxidase operon protein cyoD
MSSEPEYSGSSHLGHDRVPGNEASGGGDIGDRSVAQSVRSYVLGLASAIVLTIASFWAAQTHLIYGPAIPVSLVVLAIAQMGVHLVFFLHVTTAPDHTNTVLALAFGLLIASLVVFGSVWIMYHLNHNMMPMGAPLGGGD